MHHRFNNFTGRLIGNPNPLNKAEAPKVVFDSSAVKVANVQAQTRAMSGSSQYSPLTESLKSKMQLFQAKNGLPVHLKGGPVDRVLFGLTLGLCAVATGVTFKMLYELSYPPKKE